MAKLPSIKRITSEQFPDLKWMPTFLGFLNPFLEEVGRAMNKQLRIADNLDGVVRTLRIDHTYPVKFRWPQKNPPTVAWIAYAREVSGNHTPLAAAIYLDWIFTGDGVFQIDAIPGLPTTEPFYIRIIALAEGT